MSPSKALFYFCISFILGITFQSFIKIPQIFLWGFLFAGVCCVAISFFKKEVMIAGFCLLFLVVGASRLQISEFTILHDELSKLNDGPEKITLAGRVISEPKVKDTSQSLRVKIADTKSIVLVTMDRYPEYHYLDEVKVTGKLKSPPEFEDFNYKNYLAKEGIYSVMSFPATELVSGKHAYHPLSFLYEKILVFKGALKKSILVNFSPPQSFILEGIMLGNDSNMPEETRAKLNATGLSHLTAISGSNVIILSSIMMIFLLALGLWRGQAFYLSIIFIWLYIIITGFPASGVRAVIMATLFLLAQKFGRQHTSSRIIVLAAALMLLENPLLLLYDAGFQLSFLASMGIIHIKPIIDNLMRARNDAEINAKSRKNKKLKKFFLDIISITLAAQIATLPLLAYHFKAISLVSLFTNLLVIPIVDLVMIFGFLAAMVGIFSNLLGFIISIPAWLLLSYFIKVMEIFYHPWGVASITSVPWILLPAYYISLAFLVKYLNKILKPKFLGF
ncbi:MAG: ComEC/Rec2 family competence protein [bacterium]|nr:ComEC/Rec2 family competence protein [bacterium]